MKLQPGVTRTSAEDSWREFVEWIGFSTLLDALTRKQRSLEDWSAFTEIAPRLFSIEHGLNTALRKWRATRKLWYPKEKPIYDAYAFVGACTQIKSQLSSDQARVFRRRVISEILPNGRLCHLDHEFRTAHQLLEFGWNIQRFGLCGDPGADFVAERGGIEVEVESKCLSPEIGLGVSYEFAARLMSRLSRELRECHPLSLTTIRIEILGQENDTGGVDGVKRHVLSSYVRNENFQSSALRVQIETSSLNEFFVKYPDVRNDQWLHKTFAELRTREGDYGYFIRRNEELIFCNLIPMRPNQQARKIMKLVSTTCDRQFSKQRPALLWLHLQGLDPGQIDRDSNGADHYFQTIARHAFTSERRTHVSSLVFTSDSDLEHDHTPVLGKDRRKVNAAGRAKGYDNLRCRFGIIHILAPQFSADHKLPFA
ncbi:hypothetical protein ACE10Z_07385 [Bradyrhizobium sp. Pha-3]|uniref:hypothetical protein n=1 Tax=Bradyrhizobium sp. Pha-3 TaxID=208375 RepID=UPI0035D50A0E